MELTCASVVQSAADFDLSLLGPVDESESVAETTSVDVSSCSALCQDSMKLRVSEIEDLLGVHQFAFWRASPSAAISPAIRSFIARTDPHPKTANLGSQGHFKTARVFRGSCLGVCSGL